MGIKVKLSKPIDDLGSEVTELDFREPVFGDILAAGDVSELELVATIIEKCANISRPAVKALALKDIKLISKKLQPFLDF